ncbi:MAG TPA: IS21 family transposase [Thermoanaerobaculia bacterium]|nr:IS21 family transposase [Thermoanaerobaculia bacterium]
MKGAGTMFDVKTKLAQGESVSAVARELGMDRKTVRKLGTATMAPVRQAGPRRPSKLDPFEPYLRERLAAGMTNSAVLRAEIAARGYTGKSSILRQWLTRHRPARCGSEPVVRFETAPGEQAQVDWADCGPVLLDGCRGRLLAFVCVLSYSRMAYVEFTVGRDLGRFLRAHQRAFAALGGVPRAILYDNERTVTAGRVDGQPTWTARFADFAATYGFVPRLCRPYRAQTKGKVERFIGYLRDGFLAGRQADSIGELNDAVQVWLAEVANVRVHATTGARPVDRWVTERLESTGERVFDTSVWSERRASRDGFVSYLANRYSVPWRLSGRVVRVQETPTGELRVWTGERLAARHDLLTDRGRVVVLPGHLALRPPPLPSRGHLRLLPPAPTVPVRPLSVYQAVAEAEL